MVRSGYPYDTIIGKPAETVVKELDQLLGAGRVTLAEGSHWLLGQRAPSGPIMREHDVSYVYKCVWGLAAAGVDTIYITELLDWLHAHALQPNGDFFFPEEPPDHRIDTRVYRALTFMKYAALLDHPLAHDPRVIERLMRYQDLDTGGVFHYIGEDPAHPRFPDFMSVGDTSFFGEFAIVASKKDEAMKAGAWLRNLVMQNIPHMTEEGTFYCLSDRRGELLTEVGRGERIFKMVNSKDANQMGWNIGCSIACLADLYDAMRDQWQHSAKDAQPFLDAALALLDFEDRMPFYTYFYPSKCKVIWGCGELMRVLIKYGFSSEEVLDKLYRAARRVFMYTFLATQLPDGSWPAIHYPLSDDAPELHFDYRVIKGHSLVPATPIPGSATSSFLPAVEVVGEILGEIGAMIRGFSAMRGLYSHHVGTVKTTRLLRE